MLITDSIRMFKALEKEPLAISFSTGKDSIACLDLAMKYHNGIKKIFYLYWVKGLEIKEKILNFYENKYNIEIDRRPCPEFLNYKNKGKKITIGDIEKKIRLENDISWIVSGIRKNESIARAAIISFAKNGVDERNLKLYPVHNWTSKEVFSYIKKEKLPLPIEYSIGAKRDIYVPDGKYCHFIKMNFPNDYKKIISTYPEIEMAVWRIENGS